VPTNERLKSRRAGRHSASVIPLPVPSADHDALVEDLTDHTPPDRTGILPGSGARTGTRAHHPPRRPPLTSMQSSEPAYPTSVGARLS
jgi:hypothetical protein